MKGRLILKMTSIFRCRTERIVLNLLLTVLVVTKGCDKIRRNQGYQSTVHSVLEYGSYCVLRYCVGEISVSEKCNGASCCAKKERLYVYFRMTWYACSVRPREQECALLPRVSFLFLNLYLYINKIFTTSEKVMRLSVAVQKI